MAEVLNGDGPSPSSDAAKPGFEGQRPSLDGEHDPHFEPIITLPEVKIPTLEEEETVLYRSRAKLFRHDKVSKEWKERGTGEAKLLYHEKKATVRIIMRRDKTLKLCANHYVTSQIKLEPKVGTDRVWVWTTPADISDGVPKAEILAMRFMNAEAAQKWKEKFDEAKKMISDQIDNEDDKDEGVSSSQESSEDEEVIEKVGSLSLKEPEKKEEAVESENNENKEKQ